jgi:hypothetical protein
MRQTVGMWKKWLIRVVVIGGGLVIAGMAVFGRGGIDPYSFTVIRDGGLHTLWSLSAVDWAPFVQHDARTYYQQTIRPDEPQLTGELLVEETVGTVQCILGDQVQDTGYQIRDGDSAYLTPGTQLKTVRGFDPRFRLAADTEDGLVLRDLAGGSGGDRTGCLRGS